MAQQSDLSRSASAPSPLCFSLLLLLFVGSGCSALIYEIVWLQLLQLVVGASAVSLGVLLGTFMGGMCLGSLLLPRVISPRRHPLRVYAALEFGIGALGLVLLFAMPLVNRLYLSSVGHGLPNVLLRGFVCAVCLLPPTMLMGATLPAIARWMEMTRQGISWLGFFYGSNIVGAVFGCLLAGFYLLRVHDMSTATYVAVAINVTVAVVSFALAVRVPRRGVANNQLHQEPRWSASGISVYAAIALSGLCALGAEVIWTRQLSLLLGASVYTFSIILAVFLVGLGIGSSFGAALSRQAIDPRVALGVCQLLLIGAVWWTAYQLAESLPYWPIDVTLPASRWIAFQLDLLRCLWAFLPASFLWGASFPLALAAVAGPGQDPGRLVGGVYAANTVGAIVGALGFSLLVVAWLGTQQAHQLIMGLAAFSALLMFGLQVRSGAAGRRLGAWGLVVTTCAAATLVLLVPKPPAALIAYGRNLPTWYNLPAFIYTGEGMNASIAVSEFSDGTRNFHVSGKVVASNEPQDMRLQRMLGHIPALIHPAPKSVLVVGCGAGVTAGSFLVHPSIERVVVCEIEPLIPPAATKYFAHENHRLLEDPRVEVVYDDARHYIATTDARFDIITSDPIHPWVKGAATLYSRDYFELCKSRLAPGGVVTQWVPLYETSLEAVRTEMATFFNAFPHGTIWSNDDQGDGYDVVVLGQLEPTRIDADSLQARLDRADHARVVESLGDINLDSSLHLLFTYAGRAADLRPWLAGAEINHDHNLRLQYLAGMGLNQYDEDLIYETIVVYRRYPEDVFAVSGVNGRALKVVLERRQSKH